MFDMDQEFQNVAALLKEQSLRFPAKLATILENGSSISFREMEELTCQKVYFFKEQGVVQGDRVATFVKPSLDFVPVIFALFRIGAIPVFIDPGMSVQNMVNCVSESRCRVMVGVPLAFILKKWKLPFFKTVEISICLTSSPFIARKLGATPLLKAGVKENSESQPIDFSILKVKPHQVATILFTSGSTGVPKGVEVTFGILWGQQKVLRETFEITDDEVDLVPFPLFALFSAAWGITSIIPGMNPAKPAKCSGKKLFNLMTRYGVTHTAGSPAIWTNVMRYAQSKGKKIPSLKRVLMAGAPVSEKLIIGWREILSEEGHVYTPYGATEALPLSYISDTELIDQCLIQTRSGRGTCVGRPMKGVKIRVIRISDQPIEDYDDVEVLGAEQIGEVIVQGELVTQRYYGRPEANHAAKINDWDKSGPGFWHRMGDLGYFDSDGRLWFCGRKDHRVRADKHLELYPAQLEPIFNSVEGASRTALVGVRGENEPEGTHFLKPILMVEARPWRKARLRGRLLSKATESEVTQSIREVLFVKKFPTDVRHNIKINRQLLSKTAQSELDKNL